MARREPERRKRRPGGARGAGHARVPPASAPRSAAREGAVGEPMSRQARLAFTLGAVAFVAMPITYQWTFRPSSRPFDSALVVQVLELAGVVAAVMALFLGRRARAANERSSGAVWAPRLGAAAIVGYAMAFFLLASRPS